MLCYGDTVYDLDAAVILAAFLKCNKKILRNVKKIEGDQSGKTNSSSLE